MREAILEHQWSRPAQEVAIPHRRGDPRCPAGLAVRKSRHRSLRSRDSRQGSVAAGARTTCGPAADASRRPWAAAPPVRILKRRLWHQDEDPVHERARASVSEIAAASACEYDPRDLQRSECGAIVLRHCARIAAASAARIAASRWRASGSLIGLVTSSNGIYSRHGYQGSVSEVRSMLPSEGRSGNSD